MSGRLGLLRMERLILYLKVELCPQLNRGETTMGRCEKLTHVIRHCQYQAEAGYVSMADTA